MPEMDLEWNSSPDYDFILEFKPELCFWSVTSEVAAESSGVARSTSKEHYRTILKGIRDVLKTRKFTCPTPDSSPSKVIVAPS